MHKNASSSANLLLLGSFLALTAASFAQSTAPESDVPIVLDPVTVKGTQGEIYNVTRATIATKTDTALIDTPQSITILTRDLIDDTATTSIGDAMRYIPGVGTAQGEGNRDTVVLRGNSSTGDYFVDGLRDDVQYYRDFYNIDRLEALKGPSGMIFGRGGPGGVINRVTKQAVIGGESFHEVSALAGSWDQYRSTFDFNQTLGTTTALRLTAVYEDSDSFRDDVYIRRQGINPTFGWALTERTTLRVGFEYFNDERIADRGIPSFNGKPFKTDESTFFGDPDRSPTYSYMRAVTVALDHEFSGGTTLRNATRYASHDKFYQNVFPGAVNGAGTAVAISAYNQATDRENILNQTDVVFDFDTGPLRHKLLTGIELGRQETDNFRATGSSTAVGITSLGSVPVSNPRYTGPLFFNQSATDADNHSVAKNIAAYVQDQIQLLPKLQLIAGVRFDHFEVDLLNNRNGSTLKSSDNLLSPRAGLVYKPVENLALYASYTFSYIPRAGEQLASLSATNSSLDPEEFENIEVGAKWDVNPRFSFTAAAYQLDRSNQAITDPGDPTALILVDGQRVRGIELGASGHITDHWSLIGGYAYQDGETQEDNGAILAGTRIQQLPRNTFSFWNRYDFNSTWGVGIGAIYRDEIFAAANNLVTLPSFVRFDAALFYRFNEHLRAQLNVENIFEKDYYASAHNNNNITPGSPLAVRLGITARF